MPVRLIPAGYLYKHVMPRPDWIPAESGIADIHSLSDCISENFCEYIEFWKHNGYWLFDDPATMEEIAKQSGTALSGMTLFYYEAYPLEFDAPTRAWRSFDLCGDVNVTAPSEKELRGYDVCTFSTLTAPECSPLSCNQTASVVRVNKHCLFETFDRAKSVLEAGALDNSEPGPFRIFAVSTVDRRRPAHASAL
jgi:hypothetical protein